jgi:hypothetical protein
VCEESRTVLGRFAVGGANLPLTRSDDPTGFAGRPDDIEVLPVADRLDRQSRFATAVAEDWAGRSMQPQESELPQPSHQGAIIHGVNAGLSGPMIFSVH